MAGADGAGLNDRSGMGGAQINVDFQTGLGGDYLMILRVIAATERSRGEIQKNKQRGSGLPFTLTEQTAFNAAYIQDEGRPKELAKELGALISGMIAQCGKTLIALTEVAWRNEFFWSYRFLMRKYPTDDQLRQFTKLNRNVLVKKIHEDTNFEKLEENEPSNNPYNEEIERFQALNITNIRNKDESLRRVEFRDFNAIYDIEDLGMALNHVYSILVSARENHLKQTKELL